MAFYFSTISVLKQSEDSETGQYPFLRSKPIPVVIADNSKVIIKLWFSSLLVCGISLGVFVVVFVWFLLTFRCCILPLFGRT